MNTIRFLAAWAIFGWVGVSASAADKDEELSIPPPESLKEETKDGIGLAFTYFPGGYKKAKDGSVEKIDPKTVVPIIMLHDWNEKTRSRKDFLQLAAYLQQFGHAVVVPDLRGHGQSTTYFATKRPFTALPRRPTDMPLVKEDVETMKRFLKKKNNAGELNLSMLTVIGAEFGANLAVNWTIDDYSWPDLPGRKQGKDVQALVLLSPTKTEKGLSIVQSVKHPSVRDIVSVLIISGTGSKSYKDAKFVREQLQLNRPKEKDFVDQKDQAANETLKFLEPDTALEGTDILKGEGLQAVWLEIAKFVHRRLVVKREDFPWIDRSAKS